tara:strand:- start:185 stop:1021 length:837 start_codon:yes stop_codon:yes gene_type:complete
MAANPSAVESNVSRVAGLHAELLTGHTGVRITGTPIPEMSDAQVAEVQRLVSEYCVGAFPDQFLGPRDHVQFMARFGEVMITPGVDSHPDHPDVNVVANPGSGGPKSGGFHTDTCFVDRPPAYTSLSGVEVPDHGGDTLFANQYLAYETLSDVMRGWLAGLRLQHVVTGTARPEEVPNPVWHPAVRTNPVTGRKALYVTLIERCHEAEGMTSGEARHLLEFLYRHSHAQHAMYRHRWQVGDFVMWDNRCALHAATYDHGDQPRTLYRVMVEGEVPFEQ